MLNKIKLLTASLILALSIIVLPASPVLAASKPPVHHLVVTIHKPAPLVSPAVMKAWAWVGWCETHDNWKMEGSMYAGALGITRTNWISYGGQKFAVDAAHATPQQQAYIASRIQGPYPIPDQPTGQYCNSNGW